MKKLKKKESRWNLKKTKNEKPRLKNTIEKNKIKDLQKHQG
jgi:hypothetical protein